MPTSQVRPPALLAQATDPAAALAHLELWQDLLLRVDALRIESPKAGEEVVPSPALIALEKEAQESPRWPGGDPIAEALLTYIHALQRSERELTPALVQVMHTQGPRDADQAKAEALWLEIVGIRAEGWDSVNQAIYDFGQANGVRMHTPNWAKRPVALGEELPGGAMLLPVSYRKTLASLHLSEVRGVCNQGVAVMNQALSMSADPKADLSPLRADQAQALAELSGVPPWMGDAEFRDACQRVLERQSQMLEQDVPAMQEALSRGDSPYFNTLARDQSAALRALQLDLHDAEASFRLRWGLQALEAPPKRSDDGAHQAADRLAHWSSLVNQAALLSTQMRINLLLDGVEYEEQAKQVSARLAELQGQAKAAPPFDGEDTLRKPAIAVLDVLEQSYGDWGVQAAALVRTTKPREADQRAYQAIVDEEEQAMDKAMAEYRLAHAAFAETHGVNLVSLQTLDSLHPPVFLVTLPGPKVELPGLVRISFAAGHQSEVNEAVAAGLEAWNTLVREPVERWPELLPQVREVVARAQAEVLSIPPWMGQETLVSAAHEALSIWLESLDKVAPRMIQLEEKERTRKNVDQFNQLSEALNQSGGAAVAGWNAANAQWAEDWQYGAAQAHQEGMVAWAIDSRELLKVP